MSRKPRIGVFANNLIPAWDYRLASARRLASQADFTFVLPAVPRRFEPGGFRFLAARVGEGFHLAGELRAFADMIGIFRRHRFERVHFYTTKHILLGPLLARLFGVRRSVLTVTGLGRVFIPGSPGRIPMRWAYLALFRISAGLAQAVLFQNERDYAFLSGRLPRLAAKMAVIGSAADPEPVPSRAVLRRTLRALGWKPGEVRLIFSGRLLPEKGVLDVLRCASDLKRVFGPRVRIVLTGLPSQNRPEAIQAVREAQARGEVDYLGWRDDLLVLISLCRVFLFPSRYGEGLPRVVLEAAALGRPCLGYRVPGIDEAVLDGVSGCLVAPGDVAALTREAEALIRDAGLRRRLGSNARRRHRERYSVASFTARLAKVYGLQDAGEASDSGGAA